MTEAEWLVSADLSRMFEHLRTHRIGRRLRLGLALCDLVWHVMPEVGREAVAVAERFSRREATEAERVAAFEQAGEAYEEAMCDPNPPLEAALYCAYRVTQVAAEPDIPADWDHDLLAHMAFVVPKAFSWAGKGWDAAVSAEKVRLISDLIRDIFGNPFRPITLLPAWRTDTALALAQQMYESRDFSAMPILADALMDAGCEDEAILTHCRGPGPHVRGCWVTDALLNKV